MHGGCGCLKLGEKGGRGIRHPCRCHRINDIFVVVPSSGRATAGFVLSANSSLFVYVDSGASTKNPVLLAVVTASMTGWLCVCKSETQLRRQEFMLVYTLPRLTNGRDCTSLAKGGLFPPPLAYGQFVLDDNYYIEVLG